MLGATEITTTAMGSASQLSQEEINQEAINEVESFIKDSYQEYYEIVDLNCVVDAEATDDDEVIVNVNIKKKLLADDVTELPYIKGMMDATQALRREASISTNQQQNSAVNTNTIVAEYLLDKQIDNTNEYIGEIQDQNETFKVKYDITNQSFDDSELEVLSVEGYISADSFAPQSWDKLYKQGVEELDTNIEVTKAAIERSYPNIDVAKFCSADEVAQPQAKNDIKYDRIKARDYANKYTSNSSGMYDTSYWNPAYAWHTENGGVDCANYVSQAIHAGGIPTDNVWKPESLAWVNTGKNISNGLKQYMTKTKDYFINATRTTCGAGGFIFFTDSNVSHVVFVVSNDTVTMLYSAHTQDRLKASFATPDFANRKFFAINPVYM